MNGSLTIRQEMAMSVSANCPYRVGIRPSPRNRSWYLWSICGTAELFREESEIEYDSIELALQDANKRLAQLV
jgi:hypothetical protein